MANGVYAYAGFDSNGDGFIDTVIDGVWIVSETGDPADDNNVLVTGEQFTASLQSGGPGTQDLLYAFGATGSPGEDSIAAAQVGGTGQIFLSDDPILVGSAIPAGGDSSLPICFGEGTLISTKLGECLVEDLKIGDLLQTSEGRFVPVKWIGRQTVHKLFTLAERFVPVRVTAGALGDGLPHTDLVLTAAHALILDGLAINASALVNGTTIAFDPIESLPDRVTYYHVETDAHDVILANGAPAETYVDYVQRAAFDNHAEYLELYGEDRTITEMDLPRVSAARLVPPSIRARLNGEAAA